MSSYFNFTGEVRLSPPITTGTPDVFHLPASLSYIAIVHDSVKIDLISSCTNANANSQKLTCISRISFTPLHICFLCSRYSHKRLRSLVEFHSRVSLHNCHDIKSYSTFIYYTQARYSLQSSHYNAYIGFFRTRKICTYLNYVCFDEICRCRMQVCNGMFVFTKLRIEKVYLQWVKNLHNIINKHVNNQNE